MKHNVAFTTLIAAGLLLAMPTTFAANTKANSLSASVTPARGINSERKALIQQVVTKWSSYVQKVRGVQPQAWAKSMSPTFATVDIANFRRAAGMTTYEGMVAALLGQKTTDAQVITALAKNGSLSTIQALGSPSSDLVYNVITPCRVIDTRGIAGDGILAAGAVRDFEASRPGGDFTNQGGAASDCGIPADPAAVVLNVTLVHPQGPGFVTLFPYGATQPLSSSINNVVGADVGNETVVKQTIGDVADFSAFSYANTHMVADAVGYFSAPVATAMDCTTANGTQAQVDPGNNYALSATCPAGYALTGGGPRIPGGDGNLTSSESYPNNANNTWFISGKNTSGVSTVVQARASCCRVPGR